MSYEINVDRIVSGLKYGKDGQSENPNKIQKYGLGLTCRPTFCLNKHSQINAESPRRHGAQILLPF
jgi:hypothetical protein